MSVSYPFRQVPLTPVVAAYLLRDRFAFGEVFSRAEAIRTGVSQHISNGGLPAQGAPQHAFKKALSELAKQGFVEPTGVRGYWRATAPAVNVGTDAPIERGQGSETLYVYYFPAYRDQAAYLGRDTWPIKIGMTRGHVPTRIRDQIGTAMPEEPVVGLRYACADAASLEKAVHSVLTSRGHNQSGPGREWYMSSVADILDIIEYVS